MIKNVAAHYTYGQIASFSKDWKTKQQHYHPQHPNPISFIKYISSYEHLKYFLAHC